MRIKFKNYIIEDNRNAFILSILWTKGEESKNKWEEYIKEQIYPYTLQLCFEEIFKIEKMNIKE